MPRLPNHGRLVYANDAVVFRDIQNYYGYHDDVPNTQLRRMREEAIAERRWFQALARRRDNSIRERRYAALNIQELQRAITALSVEMRRRGYDPNPPAPRVNRRGAARPVRRTGVWDPERGLARARHEARARQQAALDYYALDDAAVSNAIRILGGRPRDEMRDIDEYLWLARGDELPRGRTPEYFPVLEG